MAVLWWTLYALMRYLFLASEGGWWVLGGSAAG